MGLDPALAGRIKRVKIYFFGFISQPDSGDVTAYVYANQGETSLLEKKVLVGRSSGRGDNVATSNTVWVTVDENGKWSCRGEKPGFNNGLFADIQGYELEAPILS